MTVEEGIYSALRDLVADRVFPDEAPFSTPRPYITYQKVGGQSTQYVDGTQADHENGLYQFNVWADSRMQANEVARQVENCLIAFQGFTAESVGAFRSDYDPDIQRAGTIQEFSIWSLR